VTQKEFPHLLVEEFQVRFPEVSKTVWGEIEKNIEADLFSNLGGHFNSEDLRRLRDQLSSQMQSRKTQDLDRSWSQIWGDVMEEFHRSKYWGLSLQRGAAPSPPPTEEQKVRRELWTYIWALVQSTIILKFVIYYFGIRAAEEHDEELKVYLYLFIGISFLSLFFFAYRKRKENPKD